MNLDKCSEGEIASIFNNNLVDLLEQLEVIVNSLAQQGAIDKRSKANLEFYKNLINKAICLGQEIVIEGFGTYILKTPNFVDKIMERDENFFMEYNFEDDTTDKNLRELVLIIKNVIGYLNDDNKGIIFDYLGIMCETTVTYASKKYMT
jgi:hypothetical protein